jgi:hypothetical protein
MYNKSNNIPTKFAVVWCLLLPLITFAAEQSISFDVPIDIKSYPVENQDVAVWCELRTAQGQTVAANGKHFPLSGGVYSGSQQVKVLYQPQDAINIKNYRCAILVESKSAGAGTSKSFPTNGTILSQVNGSLN